MLRSEQPLRSLLFILAIALFALPFGCGKSEEAKPAGQKKASVEKIWIERWSQETPLTVKRAGLAAVAHKGRIYAIGGGDFVSEGLNIFDSVEYSDVGDDGSLGEWQESGPLTIPRVYPVAITYNGYIYVVGGESKDTIYTGAKGNEPPTLLNSIERAKINDDGSLGEWTLEAEKMSFARRGGEVFAYNGWLYAAGGFNGAFLNDVEKAKINEDGSIGKWSREKEWIKEVRYISGFMQRGDKFYVTGGHINSPARATESVEMATAQADSNTSAWTDTAPLHTRRFLNTALVVGDAAYSIAGHNTVNLAATEKTTFNEDGTLNAWEADTPLNIARRAAVAVEVNNRIYVLGGMIRPMEVSVSIDSVEAAAIEPGKKLGNWIDGGTHAEGIYNNWREEIPEDVKNHILHGRAYLKQKKYDTVLFDVSEALKVKPDFFAAYNLKGDAHFRMGKKERAVEALEKSLELEADNLAALIGLGYMLVDKKEYANAITYYKRAVAAHPDAMMAHYNLGQTYLVVEDYASAIVEFEWMLDADPDSKEAKHFLEMSRKSLEKQSGKK